MAEKDYETWLAEAKAALDGYSAEQAAIAKLYEQAKQNAAASFDAQQKQLADKLTQDKNSAANEIRRTERNIGQTLAARGLAFSGENAQTHLDLNLALQDRFAQLERDKNAREQELGTQKAATLTELDLAHANARAEGAKQLSELRQALAEIASQKPSVQTGTEQAPEGESADTPVGPPNLKGKSFAERIRLMLEYAAKQFGKPKEDGTYTPTISARDLAKQLVSSAGGSGSVNGYEEQEALKLLLNALTEEHALEESYLDELMLNLRSMGYRPHYATETDLAVKELCKESTFVYADHYDRYYKIYELAGYEPANCDQEAGALAVYKQLAYVYERSESKERFELAVAELGMQEELKEFYKKLKASDNQYKLGSQLERK